MKGSSPVSESLLRQRLTELGSIASWAPHILAGLERFIRNAGDYDLFRVNPIQYATANGLSEAEGIDLFVHAAKGGPVRDAVAAHLRLLPADRRKRREIITGSRGYAFHRSPAEWRHG